MTDRYNALTVVLDGEIRSDDAAALINAIQMIKGVLKVTPHVADGSRFAAEQQVKQEIRAKLFELLKDI